MDGCENHTKMDGRKKTHRYVSYVSTVFKSFGLAHLQVRTLISLIGSFLSSKGGKNTLEYLLLWLLF